MHEPLVFVCTDCGPGVEANSADLKCAKCGKDVVVKKQIKNGHGGFKYESMEEKPKRRK